MGNVGLLFEFVGKCDHSSGNVFPTTQEASNSRQGSVSRITKYSKSES